MFYEQESDKHNVQTAKEEKNRKDNYALYISIISISISFFSLALNILSLIYKDIWLEFYREKMEIQTEYKDYINLYLISKYNKENKNRFNEFDIKICSNIKDRIPTIKPDFCFMGLRPEGVRIGIKNSCYSDYQQNIESITPEDLDGNCFIKNYTEKINEYIEKIEEENYAIRNNNKLIISLQIDIKSIAPIISSFPNWKLHKLELKCPVLFPVLFNEDKETKTVTCDRKLKYEN